MIFFLSPPTVFGRVLVLKRYGTLWLASRKRHTAGGDPHTNRKPPSVATQLSWWQSTRRIHLKVIYSRLQVVPVLSKGPYWLLTRWTCELNLKDEGNISSRWERRARAAQSRWISTAFAFESSICTLLGCLLFKKGLFTQVNIRFTSLCQQTPISQ